MLEKNRARTLSFPFRDETRCLNVDEPRLKAKDFDHPEAYEIWERNDQVHLVSHLLTFPETSSEEEEESGNGVDRQLRQQEEDRWDCDNDL